MVYKYGIQNRITRIRVSVISFLRKIFARGM